MSITASVTGVFIALMRSIKFVPKRIAVFLWAVPFLRMILPFGLNNPYSLMSLISNFTTKAVTVYHPAKDVVFSMTNCVMAADEYFPLTYKTNALEMIFSVASVIWIIVTAVIFSILTVCYFTAIRDTGNAVRLYGNVYFSKKAEAPAVYGIVKPKIILPFSCKESNIDLIVLHEKAHIKSGDNLFRILAIITAALHWFNPFAWIFLKLFLSDLEMSCDERVVSKLDERRRKEYALTLIENRQRSTLFSSGFGGSKLRKRVENILTFKKLTVFSLISFIALSAAVFFALLTNAS